MREQYKGLKKDGPLSNGSLVIEAGNTSKEKQRVLKEYKHLSGAEKLIMVYDGEKECYEEVSI